MTVTTQPGKFPTGQLVITRGAAAALTVGDLSQALLRHLSGDWGNLDCADWELNEAALQHGANRLFSVYESEAGTKFYLITEWDRSVTTFLLPEEY